jgi:hypothetical protein
MTFQSKPERILRNKIMKSIFLISLLTSTFIDLTGQQRDRYTISGYVKEAGSGELLVGVNIFLSDHKTGTITNSYGFFSLTLPEADSIELIVSYVGFTPEIRKISLHNNVELNIDLKSDIVLDEVKIIAERKERLSESVRMSTVSIPVAQIKNVPSLLGEKDVFKVLQLMPGVQKGSEGNSGLYVRGGGPDQNLVILDDAIVYNASHLFGFFSLFNGDALKSVELTKGGFPARYGGRLSAVLEMIMKEGNKESWHGEGGIGLISSRLTLEGPLKKNKSSILVSGRRTYADLLLAIFQKEEKTGYYFYDLNAKANYDFGRKNKLYLSGYFGKDKFYNKLKKSGYEEKAGFLWGNATGTLRWNHLFNSKIFSNTSLVFSNYSFGIYDKLDDAVNGISYNAEYYSGIRDYSLKYDIEYLPNPAHFIRFGVLGIYHHFNPHAFIEVDAQNNINTNHKQYINGIESGIYAEDVWIPFQKLKINYGLRFSHFIAIKNQYHYFEPRVLLAWRIKNDIAVKGSFALMNQYIHLLSNTGVSLPTDLWVPTTDKVKPQHSRQIAIGFVKDFDKKNFSFSFESYYKTMKNVISYKEGATFMDLDEAGDESRTWEDNITDGRAWSYGFEFLLQKKEGKLSGWIGYTLSWTLMQFDSLNYGQKFFARYDRRHDISIVAIYKPNNHIVISATWVYGTGNAITLPISEYWSEQHHYAGTNESYYQYSQEYPGMLISKWVEEFGEKNNFRMKAYHRLDLGIQFHKKKKWGERTWEITIYNAYNRKNPFFYYNDDSYNNGKHQSKLKQVSLFPIIPSVTYSFKF